MAPLPCCVTEVDGPAALRVKGALQTSELMEELVAPTAGLRTERRMSHGFVMQVDRHPRVLLISDAALNVQPDAVVGQVQARVRSPSQSGQRAALPCPQCVPA